MRYCIDVAEATIVPIDGFKERPKSPRDRL
jgi:hypothetical protein